MVNADPINKASIEEIENGILTICLNEAKPDVSNYHTVIFTK